jgi:hypothetical protein
MRPGVLNDSALENLTRDGWLLFLTRFTRLFAYGALSVILVLYLTGLGLSEPQTGMVLTLTLGRRYRCFPVSDDPGGSDWTPPHAHCWCFSYGRRRFHICLHE